MTITDDIVKGLRNATPLYAVAGTADLAAEKLREVPALIGRLREQAPERFERIKGTDPRAVQDKVATGARDAQARLTETYREMDLKAFREMPDFKKLGESVQDLAMQGVGRATGYAVKARETYDGLAERGKGAVATWRGEGEDGKGGKDSKHVLLTGGKAKEAQDAKTRDAKPRTAAKPAGAKPTPRDVKDAKAGNTARKAAPRRTTPAARKTGKPSE
jgi:hypothetical protein